MKTLSIAMPLQRGSEDSAREEARREFMRAERAPSASPATDYVDLCLAEEEAGALDRLIEAIAKEVVVPGLAGEGLTGKG